MNSLAPASPPIFDGHNDAILSLVRTGKSFVERGATPYVDLPRAREAGLMGGFFAVFIRHPAVTERERLGQSIHDSIGEVYASGHSWPEPMSLEYAQSNAINLVGRLLQIAATAAGLVRIVRTAGQIEECMETDTFAMLLHLEGAEPLDPDGFALEAFYAAGVRSVGLTHSRRNRFAHGVPLAFPGSPNTGPGLTSAGRDLVRQLNRRRMLIDLSHLNEAGFWDVAKITNAPLVATHSNAHFLSRSPRNLTDEQLDAIRESRGIVGVNFHVGFLRADGARDSNTPISRIVDHIDHMVSRMGIDHVGLGSDFADAAVMPKGLEDVAGLPRLVREMRRRGCDGESLRKLLHGNWIRVLRDTFGR